MIRVMTIEDYDEVYKLWKKIRGFGIRSIDDSKEGVERFLRRNPTTSFVAVKEGKIVGSILCGHDGRQGSLYHVCVNEAYRRHGIGKDMVVHSMKALQEEKINKVCLIAFAQNNVGNAFWNTIGWTERLDVNYYDFILQHLMNSRKEADHMKIIEGGVTAAKGFEAAATAAGIKYQGRTDMAIIYSEKPCKVAGTFTTNVVKAAPVKWDRQIVESKQKSQAVIVNSGIANACTGEEGMKYCEETAKEAGKVLGIDEKGVLVGSTGVIGMQIPIDKIKAGITELAKGKKADLASGTEAAKAIMTTDTKKKEVAVTFMAGDTEVTIGGMAKGSGMIHPNMCTMLAFITTDAKISKKALQAAMSSDVEDTYNMISVDGDTSTNDTALLLANGMAGNEKIKEGTPEFDAFKEALHYVNETLAKAMAGDGEGATALFEVKVVGAQTKEQAKVLAKSVVCSNLTKAAIAGHDANWGRILCAMGYSGAQFDPEQVDLFFESRAGKLQIIANGTATDYSEEKATEILSQEKVTAIADLKAGDAEATAWGCDLTHGYIDINADYRS